MGYSPKTGIIISKMVAFLGYQLSKNPDDPPTPAVDILKILEDKTFLSFPSTHSAREKGLNRRTSADIKLHNRRMRAAAVKFLGEGAVLFAMAPSGTTDKPKPDNDPNTIFMDRLGKATFDLLNRPRTYVLPIAVHYKDEQTVFEICHIPRIVKTEDEAHESMQKIAETLTDQVPDKTFVYQS